MKNKKILGIAALAAVTAVGGSFAYFQQTMVADNPFNTGSYGTTLQESFNPADGENWQPGATVSKEVKVVNTGNQPVIVRAKFDETWTRKGEDTPFKSISAADAATADGESSKKITNVYQAPTTADEDDGSTNGLTENDDTVVRKNLGTSSKWILGADGWYYYISEVQPAGETGSETDLLLESVTLASDLDLGAATTRYTYSVNGLDPIEVLDDFVVDGKVDLKALSTRLGLSKGDKLTTDVKVGTENGTGYSNADYVLTVTTQTVQATADAVQDAFKDGDTAWVMPEELKGAVEWSFVEQ